MRGFVTTRLQSRKFEAPLSLCIGLKVLTVKESPVESDDIAICSPAILNRFGSEGLFFAS